MDGGHVGFSGVIGGGEEDDRGPRPLPRASKARICRTASKPFIPGISMSMNTSSGDLAEAGQRLGAIGGGNDVVPHRLQPGTEGGPHGTRIVHEQTRIPTSPRDQAQLFLTLRRAKT